MASNNTVLINTSYGPVTIELYPDKAPVTVSNFLSYIDEGFYDFTIFHRVINNFMIQAGGYTAALTSKVTHAPIVLESNSGLSNLTGTIAMARTSAANSATAQFYINTVDNTSLDYQSASSPGYAVFGKVSEGLDVVDAIESAHTFSVTASGTAFPNLPFPNLVTIYRADRYEPAGSNATPTTHTLKSSANNVASVSYTGGRADYGVKHNTDNTLTVTLLDGQHSSETVSTASRLEFTDSKWAYDLNGNAGKTALMLNAAFGYTALRADLVTIGLDLFDQGQSLEAVAGLALGTDLWRSVAGGTDNASFVKVVYKHVVGSLPDAATQAVYQGMLDRHEMTQSQLLAAAAQTEVNAAFIDLVGIAHSGLAYL